MLRSADNHSLHAESQVTQQNAYSIAFQEANSGVNADPVVAGSAGKPNAVYDPFAFAPVREYPAGTVLFEQGTPVQHVYKLDQGLAKTVASDPEGREVIIWLCSTPGMYIGAACAICDLTLVSSELVTNCKLRCIPADDFRNALKNDAALSWDFHRTQSKLLWQFVNKLVQFGCHSVQERFEQLLWQLVQAMQPTPFDDGSVQLSLPLKYWEIAELIAVSPEHLCRVIRSMELQGILRRDKGQLILLEPDKLSHSETELW